MRKEIPGLQADGRLTFASLATEADRVAARETLGALITYGNVFGFDDKARKIVDERLSIYEGQDRPVELAEVLGQLDCQRGLPREVNAIRNGFLPDAAELVRYPYLAQALPKKNYGWHVRREVPAEHEVLRTVATGIAIVGAIAGVALLVWAQTIAAIVCGVALVIALGIFMATGEREKRDYIETVVPERVLDEQRAAAKKHAECMENALAVMADLKLPDGISVERYVALGTPSRGVVEVHLAGTNGELAASRSTEVYVAERWMERPLKEMVALHLGPAITAAVESEVKNMRLELMILR